MAVISPIPVVKLSHSPVFPVRRLARADYKYSREREAIRAEHSRKKEEKESRREEIRKKYGTLGKYGWYLFGACYSAVKGEGGPSSLACTVVLLDHQGRLQRIIISGSFHADSQVCM